MGYFWDLAKELPAGIEDHPFYRIIENHYGDYQSEDRLAFLAVKTSEAVDYFDQLIFIGVGEDNAREQALAATMRDSDPTEEWERQDAEEETAAILSDHLAKNAVQRLSLDAQGHEHKGKGPGGGQFTSKGGGGNKGDFATKSPWEMTRKEFVGHRQKLIDRFLKLSEKHGGGVQAMSQPEVMDAFQAQQDWGDLDIGHAPAVSKAFRQGKTVPAEVLKEYPKLNTAVENPKKYGGEKRKRFKPVDSPNIDYARPPSDEDARSALDEGKRDKFGAARSLPKGKPVALRIDIPAFLRHGTYVVTVHDDKGTKADTVGTAIGYDSLARLSGPVRFSVQEKAAERVATDKNKHPLATVKGGFDPDRTMPEDMDEWHPVGMDPQKAPFFYDKKTGREIRLAEDAVSVGNTVFVRSVAEYGDRNAMTLLSFGRPAAFWGLALQPGARKEINGKSYILNEHHRWALPHEAGQGRQPARPKPLPQAAAQPKPKVMPQPDTPLDKWKETAPAPAKAKAPKKKLSRYLLESHLIDFVPQREPTADEVRIAAEPGDSLEQRSARMVVSRHFLEQHGRSGASNKFRVNGKLEGMDFSQPVLAGPPPSVPPPDALSQWQAPGGKMGSYFAPIGVSPSELGIGELTVAWGVEGSPIKPRVPVLYQFPENSELPYLRSIAAPIVDNWGVEKLEQPTTGGGLQWFVPHAAPGVVRELPPNYNTVPTNRTGRGPTAASR